MNIFETLYLVHRYFECINDPEMMESSTVEFFIIPSSSPGIHCFLNFWQYPPVLLLCCSAVSKGDQRQHSLYQK